MADPTSRFTGYVADTRESRRIHHRIRYQVYCERKGFEDNHVIRRSGLERDAYDGHAIPFIFRDEPSGCWRGAARLVVRGTTRLPMEALGAVNARQLDRYADGTVAEISRLSALPSSTRTGHGRGGLLIASIGTLLSYADHFGIHTLFFLITPGLARVLARCGVPFRPCGRSIHHRGERRVFMGEVHPALAGFAAEHCMAEFRCYSRMHTELPQALQA